MTPSPSNDNNQRNRQTANPIRDRVASPDPIQNDTAANFQNETPQVAQPDISDDLPDDLSAEERASQSCTCIFE